jgi:hypothetical protein
MVSSTIALHAAVTLRAAPDVQNYLQATLNVVLPQAVSQNHSVLPPCILYTYRIQATASFFTSASMVFDPVTVVLYIIAGTLIRIPVTKCLVLNPKIHSSHTSVLSNFDFTEHSDLLKHCIFTTENKKKELKS